MHHLSQGQGQRLAGALPAFRLTLGMHHALGVPPDGVGPFRAQAFAFGPSDGLRPHSRHLTRPLAPNTVPSSQQQAAACPGSSPAPRPYITIRRA